MIKTLQKSIQFLAFLLFLGLLACGGNTQQKTEQEIKKTVTGKTYEHKKIVAVLVENNPEIENWEELNSIDIFLMNLQKSTPNEVLSNAVEISGLVQSLKDSIILKKFDIPAFKTRINILNNEALRLKDLTYIPSIKADEVNKQLAKVFDAYSSLNSKINTILSQENLENELDIEVKYIGINPSKVDEISKKSIKDNLKVKKNTPK